MRSIQSCFFLAYFKFDTLWLRKLVDVPIANPLHRRRAEINQRRYQSQSTNIDRALY